eukprot:168271-Pyramimonas_sp.AAC.1
MRGPFDWAKTSLYGCRNFDRMRSTDDQSDAAASDCRHLWPPPPLTYRAPPNQTDNQSGAATCPPQTDNLSGAATSD